MKATTTTRPASSLRSDSSARFAVNHATPGRPPIAARVVGISSQIVKDANARAGQHFFDADTLRFFDSRVMSEAFAAQNDRDGRLVSPFAFLVTSERFHGSTGSAPRKWSVRVCHLASGEVDTFADSFQGFDTPAQARSAARRAAMLSAFMACGWGSSPTADGRDVETFAALLEQAQSVKRRAESAAAEAAKPAPVIVGRLECLTRSRDRNGNCYHAMRYTDAATGRTVCASGAGGESNVASTLYHLNGGSHEPRNVTYTATVLPIRQWDRETRGWPYGGCGGEQLAAFIRAELAKAERAASGVQS